MPENGLRVLNSLLEEYGDVIKTKLDEGEPSDIVHLNLNLKAGGILVCAKKRRYLSPKKEFFLVLFRFYLEFNAIARKNVAILSAYVHKSENYMIFCYNGHGELHHWIVGSAQSFPRLVHPSIQSFERILIHSLQGSTA